MKKFFIAILLTVFCGFIIYTIPAYRQKAVDLFTYSKCDNPLPYKIYSIDQRFNLTQEEAIDDIKTATDIWSHAKGKDLFTYSQKADLNVSFVYDERQALDTQIDQLNTTLRQRNTTLQQQISEYKTQVSAYEKRLDEFNSKVDKYNSEGGAPPDIYNDLIKEQETLNVEGDALNNRAKELNLSANDYNAGVSKLNKDVSQLNDVLSQKPEEGIYDEENNTITIYFVGNRDELIHTLAHEFGHALGVDHVANPLAIMYPYTTTSIILSPEDIKQLNYACRKQSLFIHLFQEFDKWLVEQGINVR